MTTTANKPIFHIITQVRWVADEAHSRTHNYQIKADYGLDAALIQPKEGVWMPQAYATQLLRTYKLHNKPAPRLIAPTPELITLIPSKYTKRSVGVLTADETVSTLFPWDDNLWWKMATAKADFFPAEPRTHQKLVQVLEEHNIPANSWLQYSQPISNIREEYRFFINNKKIATHSLYLKEGESVYDGATPTEEFEEAAVSLVTEMLSDPRVILPPQVVADVAVSDNKEAYLLEFNPVWCSGWYECDMDSVLTTIVNSVNQSTSAYKKWQYKPDTLLLNRYGEGSGRRPLQLTI